MRKKYCHMVHSRLSSSAAVVSLAHYICEEWTHLFKTWKDEERKSRVLRILVLCSNFELTAWGN